jgi:hypothetical protein
MQLKVLNLILKTDKSVIEDASRLRGYIGNKFIEYSILHNHGQTGSIYQYPRIQYKVLEGTPIIMGINEGVEVLKRISGELNELNLAQNSYRVNEIQMNLMNQELKATRENYHYAFISNWIPFNQDNYQDYMSINNFREKKFFINSILIGNVLSMCKYLEYVVDRELFVHSHLDEKQTFFKSVIHKGFSGEFIINFKIPDYFGLGKGVSHGFGTVKQSKLHNGVK